MPLYSGYEEKNDPYTQEVAPFLFKDALNALIGWESQGSRIIKAPFKTKEGITMNGIHCYAPINDKESIVARCSGKDLTILISTQRRTNYYGRQLEKDQRSTNFNVSPDALPQPALSNQMDLYQNIMQDSRKEKQEDDN
ncbi:unnamed protein product [Schistosoma mattheei]|uniref:Uncharacterized protein n=1 Tax=Schistosoma mattheei TaxID=31246 RepID=A0A3P8K762_9TREM|nr:unnamed protein product [Schistosoma mattheei]